MAGGEFWWSRPLHGATIPRMSTSQAKSYLRFPVISHGAEFLVQGYLMRRNILTYKAPQNNAGYDLICVHPDHPNKTCPICVQVKSRYATDCDRGFPVKEQTFKHFDFLIAVFLNIGNFFRSPTTEQREPEFYTFPIEFIRRHHNSQDFGGKVQLRGLDLEEYRNEKGFELIATALEIPYPSR